MIFAPRRDEVRRFFCEAWRKDRAGELLSPLEALAAHWIRAHPEYHALLGDPERALAASFTVEDGRTNPFLHLSMHIALAEQAGIDQPHGIRAVLEALVRRGGDAHAGAHLAMECLGEILWQRERGTAPADPAALDALYLECLRRQLGRDT